MNGSSLRLDRFQAALQQLHHWGPDATGIAFLSGSKPCFPQASLKLVGSELNDHTATLALGHKRLAVLDLSDRSNQPILNTSKKNALCLTAKSTTTLNSLSLLKPHIQIQ